MQFMSMRETVAADLIGHWWVGYYGGSDDYHIILLADGRGAFVHGGWWVYRYASFRWKPRGNRISITDQRYRNLDMSYEKRCLQIDGNFSLAFDPVQKRERLRLAIDGEPTDYYLMKRAVGESDLHLEYLTGDHHWPI